MNVIEQDELLPLVRDRTVGLAPAGAIPSVVIGEVIGMTEDGGAPLVSFPGQTGPAAVQARSLVSVSPAHLGAQVALAFEGGDDRRPVILGVLRAPDSRALQPGAEPLQVDLDGQRVILTAAKELVLRCGIASITLTAAGKILVSGAYLSNRSSGVLRIKGASVQIN